MRILIIFGLIVGLSGCGGNFGITEKFSETNQMIADSNNNRLQYFAEGMAACKDNAACQVALSMAFAGNMGQQQFMKPETVKDYLVAFMPYATLGVDVFRLWHNAGGDSQGMVVTGDHNVFSGVGNTMSADRSSTMIYDMPTYLSQNTTTQNHVESTSEISQTGTAPAAEPIMVEPFLVEVPAP